MLFLVLFLATQAAADPPLRQPTAPEADAICPYIAAAGEYRCDADDLAHFDTRIKAEVDTSKTTAQVGFEMIPHPERQCIAGINLSIRHSSDPVTVDWSKVAFAIDGVAVQAVPGFTRRMTTSLAQRPSTAPAGAVLAEQVFGMDDCIAGPLARGIAGDEMRLAVPLEVGGRAESFTIVRTRVWRRATEAYVFGFASEPAAVDVPTDPRPEPEGFPFWWTGVGVASGVAAGAVAGTVTGIVQGVRLGAGAQDAAACCGFGICSIVAPIAAVIGGGIGFGVDMGGGVNRDDRRRRWLTHDQRQAWVRKRAALSTQPESQGAEPK